MDIFDLMRSRRSIRKYQKRQIPRELVEKVLEAGSYAPNAGGGQRSVLAAIHDRELVSDWDGSTQPVWTGANCWVATFPLISPASSTTLP